MQPLPLNKGTKPLLQLLEVPDEQWKTVSIDFIVKLPNTHGYNVGMCLVDSVGKCSHFIATNTTCTAHGATELYLHNIWKLHRLPTNIVSD
jgi:hypothetical protein